MGHLVVDADEHGATNGDVLDELHCEFFHIKEVVAHGVAHDGRLGSGDRALVQGGKIHPRYRIMVPKDFVKPEAGSGA